MNKFVKIFFAIAATASLVNVAAASTAYYGLPKKNVGITALTSTAQQTLGYASLYNHTSQTYIANAQFFPSGKIMNNIILNPAGSIDPASGYPSDVITYQIDYPDTYVCISATRYADHVVVLPTTCLNPGLRADIGRATSATSALPSVTIS